MINAKKVSQSIHAELIKNSVGKTVEVCIDIKTYEAMAAACNEWEKIQKTKRVRWVRVNNKKK